MSRIRTVYSRLKAHPILTVMLLIQILIIIYINLFQLQRFIGYDCSAYYLQAMEMWNQKTLFPQYWAFQTTLCWDSPVIFAAPLYGLFHNIFFAYGVANILCIFLMMIALGALMHRCGASNRAALLIFILFLTPYISFVDGGNNIEYFSVLFSSMGAYSLKLFIFISILLTYLILSQDKPNFSTAFLGCAVVLLCILTGISSGFYILVFCIAPAMLYYIYSGIRKNNWKSNGIIAPMFLMLCACAIVFGKLISIKVLGFASQDSSAIWVSLDKFWDNLFSIFSGYLKLTGAFPVSGDVPVLTGYGIGFLFRLCLSVAIIFGGGTAIVRSFKKTTNSAKNFLGGVFFGNILVFLLVYTTYGSAIFETRYLIPAFVILLIFFSEWFDDLLKKQNLSLAVFTKVGVLSCIVITNITSYNLMYKSQNQFDLMEQIVDQVAASTSPIVYVAGDELGIIARNLRVLDNTKVYKCTPDMKAPHHWGDYTYYDETSEYSGSTIMVATSPFYATLPQYLMNQYNLVSMIPSTNIGVYKAENKPVDLVAGMTNNTFNVDYPYTDGIILSEHGQLDDYGRFISDGSSGFISWGPYCPVESGTYNFTLNYELLSDYNPGQYIGFFDIAVNSEQIVQMELNAIENSITIHDVMFDSSITGSALEYRVNVTDGVILRVDSFEIERVLS